MIKFSGLYHVKTLPDKDWVEGFAPVQNRLGFKMNLLSVKATDVFLDEPYTSPTHEFSVYAGLNDDDTLILKTPDYVDIKTEASLLGAVLKKLGLDSDLADKFKQRLPQYIREFSSRELSLVSSLLDLPIVANPEKFYDRLKTEITSGEKDEATLCAIVQNHPLATKINQDFLYDTLVVAAADQGYAQLIFYLLSAKNEAYSAKMYSKKYLDRIVARNQVEETKALEKTLLALNEGDTTSIQQRLMRSALNQGQHEVFHYYHQQLGQAPLESGDIHSLLLNKDFEIIRYYIEYFDLLETLPVKELTRKAVYWYVKQDDDSFMQYLIEHEKLDKTQFVMPYIVDKPFNQAEKIIKQLMDWGFDINQPAPENALKGNLPFYFTGQIGSLYGQVLKNDLSPLKSDKTRLRQFKYLSLLQQYGVDFSVTNKAGQTVWQAVGMTEAQLNDVLSSELVKSYTDER